MGLAARILEQEPTGKFRHMIHWVKEKGNEMFGIRCAIYNGTYDKVFEMYKKANLPQ